MKTFAPDFASGATAETESVTHTARRGRLALQQSVQWLGFWTAILLPLLYLPLLYIGIGTQTGTVFLGLLGLQLIALLAGHGHNRN